MHATTMPTPASHHHQLPTDGYTLRPATAADLAGLPSVERAAAALFPPTVLPDGWKQTTLPPEALDEALAASLLWVAAVTGSNEPVGFLMAQMQVRALHIAEMDVHPAHGRRGLGAALLGMACAAAAGRGLQHVTLTTFAEVPWNGPFYERQGFERVTHPEVFTHLSDALHHETASGLSGRIAMAKKVP